MTLPYTELLHWITNRDTATSRINYLEKQLHSIMEKKSGITPVLLTLMDRGLLTAILNALRVTRLLRES